jgi:hypothetical protein
VTDDDDDVYGDNVWEEKWHREREGVRDRKRDDRRKNEQNM